MRCEWESNGRDPGFLYRGARLAVAREWAAANPRVLDPLEDRFLAASVKEKRRPALHFTLLMGIAVVILLLVTVAAFQVAQSLANALADSHLGDLVYAAQGVASTVLWELERLSGPVLEAANNKDLRDLLKDNKVKCPPNPKECRLIDAMIKNNDVQPWLKSHREEIDGLEKLLKRKREEDLPRAGPAQGKRRETKWRAMLVAELRRTNRLEVREILNFRELLRRGRGRNASGLLAA